MRSPGIKASPWKTSLHGGHSSRFCDHAESTLEEILDAAVAFGYHTFGVTEHAPRTETQYLYDEEIEMGWNLDTLQERFKEYAKALDEAVGVYGDRLHVLKGFETETVPPDAYPDIMLCYKQELNFDYIVGSVHYVDGIIIDYKPRAFEMAVESCGGMESLGMRYYQVLAEMVTALKPEVVGHFDLIRKGFPSEKDAQTPRIRRAACEALEVIRDLDAILDINTAAYRKGMSYPYPAPVYMEIIKDLAIPVCFGDDSHAAEHVGSGIEVAREYLLQQGINRITTLERGRADLNRKEVSLLI